MNIAIIGCGLIGRKRAAVLSTDAQSKLVIVADNDIARAEQLAREHNCQTTNDWQHAVNHPQVEAVIVATPNKYLMPVAVAALRNGKHVLCEKPPGRNYTETQKMVFAAQETGRVLKVGFNHRHHPAIWEAHKVCSQGEIGPLMYLRAIYGHGGRPGYDKEWRADADLCGGGELLDQGVHIVDLCRWFLGDFSEVSGFTNTYFWDLGYFQTIDGGRRTADGGHRSPVGGRLEDNAFAQLRTADGQIAQFHTSWTQWKNRFSFEVFGRDGYVRVEGLGGSYGVEKLEIGKRKMEGGAPDVEVMEFPGPDLSWQAEWGEFTTAIQENRQPLASGEESLGTMQTIAAIYQSAHTGKIVRIPNNSAR